MDGEGMSCGVFTTHLELDGDTLIGALFLTYRLDLSAFEEWILPKLLPLRHPPGEALFAEEARRRLLEVPIAVVADASCLEQVGESGDGTGGTCGVPIIRFSQPSGAFHPKLALLACKARGVRVVIGSANLTEAGITKQIELVSSFWLNDHPSTVPGLRAVLRALEKRLVKSPRGVQKGIGEILAQIRGDPQLESACLSRHRGVRCSRQRSSFSSR
jgi:hypothetical protein